ncbi:uncharacterized protein METZ01_LOCUS418127, partial [marine metagenome]
VKAFLQASWSGAGSLAYGQSAKEEAFPPFLP